MSTAASSAAHSVEAWSRRAPARPTDRSLGALDWLNFFLANLQASFGPFVAVYLAEQGWSQSRVGLVLGAGGIAGLFSLLPGGALLDALHIKRAMVALGLIMVAAAAMILAFYPSFTLVLIAEILHGATAGLIGPAIAAITLGLVGHRKMSERLGRNNRFSSAGALLAYGAIAGVSYYLSDRDMFFIAAGLTIPGLIALAFMRSGEIDRARARLAPGTDHKLGRQRVPHAMVNRCVLALAAISFLFQIGNASILPLVGERLATVRGVNSQVVLAACTIVPMAVVTAMSPWVGRWAETHGRRDILMVGLAAMPIRALLLAFVVDPKVIVVIQFLDGISAAVIGLLTALVIADCTRGSGRFNFSQGFVGTAVGIGGSISTVVSGYVVEALGYTAGFLGLAALGFAAVAVLWLFLGETKPDYENPISRHVADASRPRHRGRKRRRHGRATAGSLAALHKSDKPSP